MREVDRIKQQNNFILKDICDKYDIKIEVISLNGENIFSYTFLPHISHT